MKLSAGATGRYAQPLASVEHLSDGQRFQFARFNAEILHMPGHTPGLVCLYDREHRILFADDHLLARVSPNPLLELGPNGEEDKFRSLSTYLASARKVRELAVDWVLPGHGPPFQDHRALIDSLFGFYDQRQAKIISALRQGPKTAVELIPVLFPRSRPGETYLMLSEVVGNLEVLEEQGRVSRTLSGSTFLYRPA